jgi:hypothetical protein
MENTVKRLEATNKLLIGAVVALVIVIIILII